ncbi:hypothetical protein SAMN02745673_00442 [Marinactinospora thermotolerans DSM 45154]|uniref:Uncharacterized protein n=1 Tax=Marinactinospora thermotolerans DSM 45154 TaxID=1122192 RepID=A0A1T4KLD7_9ACTN|nr:hypothetical protein SAMN02745673_00442 [Marinactinospora thermotolerans DSM 45154]
MRSGIEGLTVIRVCFDAVFCRLIEDGQGLRVETRARLDSAEGIVFFPGGTRCRRRAAGGSLRQEDRPGHGRQGRIVEAGLRQRRPAHGAARPRIRGVESRRSPGRTARVLSGWRAGKLGTALRGRRRVRCRAGPLTRSPGPGSPGRSEIDDVGGVHRRLGAYAGAEPRYGSVGGEPRLRPRRPVAGHRQAIADITNSGASKSRLRQVYRYGVGGPAEESGPPRRHSAFPWLGDRLTAELLQRPRDGGRGHHFTCGPRRHRPSRGRRPRDGAVSAPAFKPRPPVTGAPRPMRPRRTGPRPAPAVDRPRRPGHPDPTSALRDGDRSARSRILLTANAAATTARMA